MSEVTVTANSPETPSIHAIREPKTDRKPLDIVRKRKFARALVQTNGNQNQAAKKVGISSASASKLVRDESVQNFVHSALAKAGITDDFLAKLARDGMSAFNQKIITDKDGGIVDVVNMPDWRNRHAFWRDVLMAKKILGGESEQASAGGLVIIAPDSARIITQHSATCTCEDCVATWQTKTAELRRIAANETAIEIAPTQLQAAETPSNSGGEPEDYTDRP